MDKEQIIIDGVDVSECAIYRSSHTRTLCCSGIYCKEQQFYNCYFKQLARKTQECEELKERLVRTEEDLKYQCVDCMNVKYDSYRKALDEIEKATKINCEEICGRKFEDCNDTSCFSAELLGIVNKAKDGK